MITFLLLFLTAQCDFSSVCLKYSNTIKLVEKKNFSNSWSLQINFCCSQRNCLHIKAGISFVFWGRKKNHWLPFSFKQQKSYPNRSFWEQKIMTSCFLLDSTGLCVIMFVSLTKAIKKQYTQLSTVARYLFWRKDCCKELYQQKCVI